MSAIQSTTNYDRFDLLDFNRDLHDTRLLEASMQKYGFLDAYPIYVVKTEDGKLRIKDGQHRFMAARKLRIPIKYVVGEDEISLHMLEKTRTKWSMQDYLDSYVRIGCPDYIAVRDYHKRTGIPLGLCTGLLCGHQGSGNFYDVFKVGMYKVRDTSLAEPVAEIVMGCADRDVKFAKHQLFVEAVAQCWLTGELDVETFLTRVSSAPQLMKKCATKSDYLNMIEEVNNYRSHKKVPLAFLAREAARRRSILRKGAASSS